MFDIYKLKCIALLIFAVALGGCEHTQHKHTAMVYEEDLSPSYYSVKAGDSVGSIATAFNMTRSELISRNGLFPPYKLSVGQKLVVKKNAMQNNEDLVVTVKEENRAPQNEVIEKQIEIQSKQQTIQKEKNDKKEKKCKLIWPIAYATSRIKLHYEDGDDGYVIFEASAGTPVKAIAGGVVEKVINKLTGDLAEYKNAIVINHGTINNVNITSLYAHLGEIRVKQGQRINIGDIIGNVGKGQNGPMLVFQMYTGQGNSKTHVDPETLLPK